MLQGKVIKFVVVAHVLVLDDTGTPVGEMTSAQLPVYPGSRNMDLQKLQEELETKTPQDKLEQGIHKGISFD